MATYHIIFISASEESHLEEILIRLGRQDVLTVSDIDRFSLRGGIVEFRMVGNRVRFDINRSPAKGAQLTISSKLLSVARAVHEGKARRMTRKRLSIRRKLTRIIMLTSTAAVLFTCVLFIGLRTPRYRAPADCRPFYDRGARRCQQHRRC